MKATAQNKLSVLAAAFLMTGAALAQAAQPASDHCLLQDSENTKIMMQLIDVFAKTTDSPVTVKETPQREYVLEGEINPASLTPQVKKDVAELLVVAKNIINFADPSCLYPETGKRVDLLLQAVEKYSSMAGRLNRSL